jgi:hypothetical protein
MGEVSRLPYVDSGSPLSETGREQAALTVITGSTPEPLGVPRIAMVMLCIQPRGDPARIHAAVRRQFLLLYFRDDLLYQIQIALDLDLPIAQFIPESYLWLLGFFRHAYHRFSIVLRRLKKFPLIHK